MKTNSLVHATLKLPMTALLDHSMANRRERKAESSPLDIERVLKAARIFAGDEDASTPPLTEEEAHILAQQRAALPQPTDTQIDGIAKRLARQKLR